MLSDKPPLSQPESSRVRSTRLVHSALAGSAMLCLLLVGEGVSADQAVVNPGLTQERPTSGRFVETEQGFMVPYAETVPGTDATMEMVPIPGGTFLLGSPESEPGRKPDEGPEIRVRVEPFWMARHEVTWGQFREYMDLHDDFRTFENEKRRLVTDENRVDAITAPTVLYEPAFTFEFGDDPQLPAVMMTQYAAKQFSKWLSLTTEQQYRLPSEAEWEYACRAGRSTRWSFGDDPEQLDQYAWYAGNTNEAGPRKVGTKAPNAWGLYDMHGNVAEWVLDAYLEDGYARLAGQNDLTALDAIATSDEVWPRVVRGGSWECSATDCRTSSRFRSNHVDWQLSDPMLPPSPWWFTEEPTRGLGFRLVRSLNAIPREEIGRYWDADCITLEDDVKYRVMEGRGVWGLVDPGLPQAVEEVRSRAQRE